MKGATRGSTRPAQAGFTIMEILIAIVILVVGLIGIMALFPAAIQSGNQTVEDSYAASIAQSVRDAISVGIRENRIDAQFTGGNPTHFFVFQHDGLPVDDFRALSGEVAADYLTTLDEAGSAEEAASDPHRFIVALPTDTDTSPRDNDDVRVFHYPKDDIGGNITNPSSIDDDAEPASPDDGCTFCPGEELEEVYRLGTHAAFEEGLDEPTGDDPYHQYGYSFSIKRARVDSNGDGAVDPADDEMSNNLFEVIIKVYRNFNPNPGSRFHEPIREFVTYISM